jgi:hypothetical protein
MSGDHQAVRRRARRQAAKIGPNAVSRFFLSEYFSA